MNKIKEWAKANKVYAIIGGIASGGYLLIGHSESLERNSMNYHYVQPSVYRKPLKS